MVTKTLTITKEAYDLLAENKLKNESFSEEIIRLLSKKKAKKLSEFSGIISNKEGEEFLRNLEKSKSVEKKNSKKRFDTIWGGK
jgi:predicted CopG family antitoxin